MTELNPAPGDSPRRAPLFIAAFGSVFLTGLFQVVVFKHLPQLLSEFHLSIADFGVVAGVVTMLSVGLGATAAFLAPRLGQARVVLIGFGIFSVMVAALGAAPWNWLAFLFGICVAWGMAYLHLANGLIVQLSPERGPHLANLLQGVGSLGKAVAPTFALIGFNWRHPFLVMAALAAMLGVIGLFGRAPSTTGAGVEKPEEEEAPARLALRQPFFWGLAALFLPILGMELVVTVWAAKYFEQTAPSSERAEWLAWLVLTVLLWGQCLGRFLAPLALRFVPAIVLICFAWGAIGIFSGTELGQWDTPAGLAALAACGLAFALPYPTFFALMCRYFPRHRGLASIACGAAQSLAFIAFGLICSQIGERWGLAWALRLAPALGALVVAGALPLYFRGEARLRRESAATPAPNP